MHDVASSGTSDTMPLTLMVQIVQGLQFVHEKKILHNDFKCDNVTVGHTLNSQIKLYIIDFGKACKFQNAKRYTLSAEEVEVYKKEHTQIAPDLRDGLVPQSPATDVYSLGRVMKRICQIMHFYHDVLKKMYTQALSYHSHERPHLSDMMEQLKTQLL